MYYSESINVRLYLFKNLFYEFCKRVSEEFTGGSNADIEVLGYHLTMDETWYFREKYSSCNPFLACGESESESDGKREGGGRGEGREGGGRGEGREGKRGGERGIYTCIHMYRGFESHLRQLIFSRKSDCLGCAVLLCLVCLFDLACFFLSSFSSLI